MIRRLRYTAEALDDLRDIADFIADGAKSEDVAEDFIIELDERCRKLAALSGTLGTLRPELGTDVRSTPHKGYIIFFRYRDDLLEIIAALHGSRDLPEHFASR